MTPASRLPVKPGEFVLDLCAAPGGKATALGAALQGEGLLVANDISTSRARALLRNIELFGISNVFVTNDTPAKLTSAFPEFFHKIMLDAPCSGEGMFRKEEALALDWSLEKSAELSKIQKELILQAADMLRPGGMLLYSTCTFAPAEDEEVISFLLEQRPDMKLAEIPGYEHFSHGVPSFGNGDEALARCVRIFPHQMNGEGHFLALLQKEGSALTESLPPRTRPNPDTRKWLEAFFAEIGLCSIGGHPFDWNRVETRGDKVYYLPPAAGNFRGITFLRNGLYLGDLKKNRFEPSQPLALALQKGEAEAVISLPVADERLTRYLKGETLLIDPKEASHSKGWHLLCAEGYPLGFGKLVNGTFKNKYPAGWRV
jgi:NOL1/NOP2/fmu family ribosome biogenesis protein